MGRFASLLGLRLAGAKVVVMVGLYIDQFIRRDRWWFLFVCRLHIIRT